MLGVVENMSGLVTPLARCSLHAVGGAAAPGPPAPAGPQAPASVDVTAEVLQLLSERYPGRELVLRTEVFRAGGGADRLCADMGVQLLGRIPLDPALGLAAEQGRSVLGPIGEAAGEKAGEGADGAAASVCLPALMDIVAKVVARTEGQEQQQQQ